MLQFDIILVKSNRISELTLYTSHNKEFIKCVLIQGTVGPI